MYWKKKGVILEEDVVKLDPDLKKLVSQQQDRSDLCELLGFSLALCAFLIVILKIFDLPDKLTELAEIGSFLGGVAGTLAALSGFLLLFATLATQQKQLLYQEQASRNQNYQFAVQSFEHSFFNLLNYYKSFISTVKIDTTNDEKSVEEFKEYVKRYEDHFGHEFGSNEKDGGLAINSPGVPVEEFKEYLYGRYREGQSQIRNLFKPLLSVLLLLREADIKDKPKYYQILQNQIPESEKLILFYLYVVCRPALYSETEYDLMLDILHHMDPKSLILENHMSWLSHPPYETKDCF